MKRISGFRVPVKTSVLRHLLWVLFIIALVLPVSRVGGLRASSAESLLWANVETPYGITFAYPNPWIAQPGAVVDQNLSKWEMRVVSPIDHYLALVVAVQPVTNRSGEWIEDGTAFNSEERLVAGYPAIIVRNAREQVAYIEAEGFRYLLSIQEYGDVPEHQLLDGAARHELQASSIEVFEEFLAGVAFVKPTKALEQTPQPATPAAPVAASSFRKPLDGGSEIFGYAGHPTFWNYYSECFGTNIQNTFHLAEDWGASAGTEVKAVADGVVEWYDSAYSNWPGRIVILKHEVPGEGTIYSLYGHLDAVYVSRYQGVSKGQTIGTILYQTNNNSHVHWEMRQLSEGPYPCSGIRHEGAGYHYPQHPNEMGFSDPTDYVNSHQGGGGSCSAPSLTTPANNATLSSRTITFKWDAVSGCQFSGYRFRLCSFSPVSNVFNCFVDEVVAGTQRTHTISNRDNMDLYWGVVAANAPNGAAWAERKFRIDPDGGGTGDDCVSNESPADDEVILFDEPSYGAGPCAKLRVGEYDDLGEYSMDKKTSSVRVGSDVDVTLFTEPDFDGDSETFENDHANLDDNSDVGKNEARSAKVTWENDDPVGDCSNPGPSQAVLFDGEDYENDCIVLEVGQYSNFHDLDPDMNDMVSSIKTGSKVKLKLYEHSDYRGDDSAFGPGSSDEDLSNNTIGKNEASSAKVYYPLSTSPTIYDIDNGDGDGAFVVAWTSVQYAEHYDVYEQPPGGGWAMIAEDQANLSREFSGKSAGTWCYTVRAGHFGENSPESAPKCAIVNPPPAPPDTPQLMDISNPEADGLYIVQWQASARATGYELQEKAESSDWTVIYTGPELSAGRVDKPNGQWCYRIKAIGLGGESDWSGEKCTIVQPPPVCVPGADGIILYEHPDFAGRCVTLTADDNDLTDNTFDNLVSSFQFVGSYANAGWQIGLFADPNYSGAYNNFSRNDPDLSNDLGNGQASSFRLWRDGDDNRRLFLGQPVNGTIHVPNDSDGYWFYGTAGQRVTIKMNKQAAGLDAYLMLYGPNWGLVARDDDSGGDNNALILDAQLWSTGVHYLYARSYAGQSAGAYTLQVQCSPGANGIVLYEGVSHTGRCVTLTGDVANLTTLAFNDAVSSIKFVGSYANAGWQVGLFADSNFSGATKNFSGNDGDLSNDIGNRVATSFRLWRDGDDGRSLATGQSLNGTIHVPNDSDGYWFYGIAGQRVTITMDRHTTSLDPYLILYGPYWGVVAQDDDSGGDSNARIYNVQLWATGVHHLYARSYAGQSAGGYTLTLRSGQ